MNKELKLPNYFYNIFSSKVLSAHNFNQQIRITSNSNLLKLSKINNLNKHISNDINTIGSGLHLQYHDGTTRMCLFVNNPFFWGINYPLMLKKQLLIKLIKSHKISLEKNIITNDLSQEVRTLLSSLVFPFEHLFVVSSFKQILTTSILINTLDILNASRNKRNKVFIISALYLLTVDQIKLDKIKNLISILQANKNLILLDEREIFATHKCISLSFSLGIDKLIDGIMVSENILFSNVILLKTKIVKQKEHLIKSLSSQRMQILESDYMFLNKALQLIHHSAIMGKGGKVDCVSKWIVNDLTDRLNLINFGLLSCIKFTSQQKLQESLIIERLFANGIHVTSSINNCLFFKFPVTTQKVDIKKINDILTKIIK